MCSFHADQLTRKAPPKPSLKLPTFDSSVCCFFRLDSPPFVDTTAPKKTAYFPSPSTPAVLVEQQSRHIVPLRLQSIYITFTSCVDTAATSARPQAVKSAGKQKEKESLGTLYQGTNDPFDGTFS